LDLGPASLLLPDGTGAQPRTVARELYIEALWAIYPWADIPDLHIFLMGFDAGEQWTRHTSDSERKTPASPDSWLNLYVESKAIPDKVDAIVQHSGV
jgi:hypothetical protein